jgi:uncharacterized protein (DUF3084 family)
MKKIMVASALVLALSPIAAAAQDVNVIPIDSREFDGTLKQKSPIREAIETKKSQIKDTQEKLREVAQKATTTRKELKDLRADDRGFKHEIAKMRATVATKVYNATIARLEKLADRIQGRIDKVKANGGVTTEAEGFLATAKTNISDAKAHIVTMQSADISTSTASTTARANFESVKTEAKVARQLLTQAKQNLQKAVNALARLNKEVKSATSTPSTN